MKLLFNFKINQKDGIDFSAISGDKNKIHLDNEFSKNSIYGKKICHGVLLILYFLKKIKIENKDYNNFFFDFINATSYDKKISVFLTKKNTSKRLYLLKQESETKLKIQIEKKNYNDVIRYNKFKEFTYKKKKSYKFKNTNFEKIKNLICFLSKYVGNIYPGEYSAINKIDIKLINKKISNKIKLNSKRLDPRFPLVYNTINYQNIVINFETSFLPKLNIKFKKPNKKIISIIKKINNNTLIIGASSGIGKDIFDLYSYNKNIKLIGTYYETKPKKIVTPNQLFIKFNVLQDLNKLPSLIKNYSIKNIYYFATPKINLNSYNSNYRKFYIDFPIRIIKGCNKKINFFYPSTTYIKSHKNYYTKFKLIAEKKLMELKNDFHNIIFIRINEMNTRQNLMLNKKKLFNFRDYLFNDKKLFKKTFFLK